MRRRALLRWIAAQASWPAWISRAQDAAFPGDQGDALRALATVVLPAGGCRMGNNPAATRVATHFKAG